MIVTSTGIIDGVIQDQYGGRGTQFNENGVPTFSLPLKIEEAPERTVSFAVVLEDKDAYPVTGGFAWIHWLAANITRQELKENDGGMTPPNQAHTYELHVFALDCLLDLETGFYLNELYHKMERHILAQHTLKGIYDKV